eukprot:RCo007952
MEPSPPSDADAMALSSEPVVRPFEYLLIPADKAQPVAQRRFQGSSDDQLRAELNAYFHTSLTVGQCQSFKEHMSAQIAKQASQAGAQQAGAEGGGNANPTAAEYSAGLLESAVHGAGGFEIVPVVYPTAKSQFKATSLYIDQVGAFKELPLNDRASKIAQKAIRGDAFMLCCIDDPRKDEWARVDCPLAHYEALLANPPDVAPDPSSREAMEQMQAQKQSKDLTPEDLTAAAKLREEGNTSYREGKYAEAEQRYGQALERLAGLPSAEVPATSVLELCTLCLLNRAAARLKLGHWAAVVADCDGVLRATSAGNSPHTAKALFRRATAQLRLADFEAANADCQRLLELCPSDGEGSKLLAEIRAREAEDRKRKRAQFGKLFS